MARRGDSGSGKPRTHGNGRPRKRTDTRLPKAEKDEPLTLDRLARAARFLLHGLAELALVDGHVRDDHDRRIYEEVWEGTRSRARLARIVAQLLDLEKQQRQFMERTRVVAMADELARIHSARGAAAARTEAPRVILSHFLRHDATLLGRVRDALTLPLDKLGVPSIRLALLRAGESVSGRGVETLKRLERQLRTQEGDPERGADATRLSGDHLPLTRHVVILAIQLVVPPAAQVAVFDAFDTALRKAFLSLKG